MIKDVNNKKVVYFGYGTICVHSSSISFGVREIEPPKEIGSTLVDHEDPNAGYTFKGDYLDLTYDIERLEKVQTILKTIDCSDTDVVIDFDEFVQFVFIKNSQKSIAVVLKGAERFLETATISFAC